MTFAVLVAIAGAARVGAEPVPPASDVTRQRHTCSDILGCQLPREIELTEGFLRRRKHGLPITLDPRPLTHSLEVLRLNVMSQTMGYLNLYRKTGAARFRREAEGRVEYLLGLGDAAFGNGPRDGLYGYLLLDAYDLLGDERCLQAGLHASDRCRSNASDVDLSMNAGLMCALNQAYAARLIGTPSRASIADAIVDRTAPKQFEDGAFPHLPTRLAGKNLSYSAWMANELLMLRDLRPEHELTEILLVRSVRFLRERVAVDGSLAYSAGGESFASDPGNADPRFWTSELASVALDLAAAGHRHEAERVLSFLFGWRLRGAELGGYPDKYAQIDSTNIWEAGSPSVLRTSLVFWYLTMIQRFDRPCAGDLGPCAVAGEDCTQLYRELGLCDQGLLGARACIGGQPTRCFDLEDTAMRSGRLCGWSHFCVDEPDGACRYTCAVLGSRLCVGDTCAARCWDPEEAQDPCERECVANQFCGMSQRRTHKPASAQYTTLAPHSRLESAPLEVDAATLSATARDDLSLQIVRVGRGAELPGAPVTIELRVNNHGRTFVPLATIALQRTDGTALTTTRLALEPYSSVSLWIEILPADSLMARLDPGVGLTEADTLNNVARVACAPEAGEGVVERTDRAPVSPPAIPRITTHGSTRITVSLEEGADVDLGLYDIAGRLVRRLWRGPLTAGVQTFSWDLRTDRDGRAAPGVYFARLRTGRGQITSRIVLVR